MEITGGDVVLTSARDIDDQVTELIAYPLDQAGGDSEPSTVLTETFNGLRARQTVVPFTCSTPGGWQPRRFRLTVSGATYRPIVVGRTGMGLSLSRTKRQTPVYLWHCRHLRPYGSQSI